MRFIKIVCVALILAFASYAQTGDELRAKLGKPDSVKNELGKGLFEEYTADPSLRILIQYSPKGRPSSLRVSPANSTLSNWNTDPVVSQAVLRKFLDDLIPKTERGEYKMGTFLNFVCLPDNDCDAGVKEDYERLIIYYNSGNGGMRYASVGWKKAE